MNDENIQEKLICGICGEEDSDEVFHKVVFPEIRNHAYPRVLKEKGRLYPYFPTAGGCDSHFRYFFAEHKALAATSIPVIHLGSIGKGHKGKTRNFQ